MSAIQIHGEMNPASPQVSVESYWLKGMREAEYALLDAEPSAIMGFLGDALAEQFIELEMINRATQTEWNWVTMAIRWRHARLIKPTYEAAISSRWTSRGNSRRNSQSKRSSRANSKGNSRLASATASYQRLTQRSAPGSQSVLPKEQQDHQQLQKQQHLQQQRKQEQQKQQEQEQQQKQQQQEQQQQQQQQPKDKEENTKKLPGVEMGLETLTPKVVHTASGSDVSSDEELGPVMGDELVQAVEEAFHHRKHKKDYSLAPGDAAHKHGKRLSSLKRRSTKQEKHREEDDAHAGSDISMDQPPEEEKEPEFIIGPNDKYIDTVDLEFDPYDPEMRYMPKGLTPYEMHLLNMQHHEEHRFSQELQKHQFPESTTASSSRKTSVNRATSGGKTSGGFEGGVRTTVGEVGSVVRTTVGEVEGVVRTTLGEVEGVEGVARTSVDETKSGKNKRPSRGSTDRSSRSRSFGE